MNLLDFLKNIVAEIYNEKGQVIDPDSLLATDKYMIQAKKTYRIFAGYCKRDFALDDYTARVSAYNEIELPVLPVNSITSIRYFRDTDLDYFDSSDYYIDDNTLCFDGELLYDKDLIISYNGGIETLTEENPLFEAFLEQTKALYDTKDMVGVTDFTTQNGGVSKFANKNGFVILKDMLGLIDQYIYRGF